MANEGSLATLNGLADRRSRPVFPAYAVMFLLLIPRLAHAPQVKIRRQPTTGPELLAEASRLAFLHNWPSAAPLFARAEEFFAATDDRRNELYAHVGRLRGE